MEWIRNISLFLVLSGLLLELIADTKYYKFAQWVAGVILLLQFIQPFKKQLLKELQLLGISEATLFPETDKIMHEIKSQIKH